MREGKGNGGKGCGFVTVAGPGDPPPSTSSLTTIPVVVPSEFRSGSSGTAEMHSWHVARYETKVEFSSPTQNSESSRSPVRQQQQDESSSSLGMDAAATPWFPPGLAPN